MFVFSFKSGPIYRIKVEYFIKRYTKNYKITLYFIDGNIETKYYKTCYNNWEMKFDVFDFEETQKYYYYKIEFVNKQFVKGSYTIEDDIYDNEDIIKEDIIIYFD